MGVWLWLWFGGNLKAGITQASIAVEGFDQRINNQVMCAAMKLCRVSIKVCHGYFSILAKGGAAWYARLVIFVEVIVIQHIGDTNCVARAGSVKKDRSIFSALLGQLVPSYRGMRRHRGKSSGPLLLPRGGVAKVMRSIATRRIESFVSACPQNQGCVSGRCPDGVRSMSGVCQALALLVI